MKRSIVIAALGLALVDHDGDGAGHDASHRPVVTRYGLGRNDPRRGRGRARGGHHHRACGLHRKEIIRPRPLRAQSVRRNFPRGTAQQDKARRRQTRPCHPRPGMAARGGPDRRKPEGRKPVRLADGSRPPRRRRSLGRTHRCRSHRREPRRSFDRRTPIWAPTCATSRWA